ncbi:hypothetical protein GW17_00013825 [Ensete ventricosum]|nr:hypothetical protein GW17_00013825 [Ensete ventricosum]
MLATTVLCCICGVAMPPNPANMCVRSQVDITEGLTRHAAVIHCPECRSYLLPPRTWIRGLEAESKELIAFCLRLVHAEFIWTEPHSKRLGLRLRVQAEALHGAILEQSPPRRTHRPRPSLRRLLQNVWILYCPSRFTKETNDMVFFLFFFCSIIPLIPSHWFAVAKLQIVTEQVKEGLRH